MILFLYLKYVTIASRNIVYAHLVSLLFFLVFIQGRTELHDAAARGDVKAVQRLLNTSLNINSRTEDVRL